MKKEALFYLLGLSLVLVLSGCVVRTYKVTKDRIDQNLTEGNRGYMMGQAPAEERERKTTRTTQVVEIELYPPLKFKKAPKEKVAPRPEEPVISEREEVVAETYIQPETAAITETNIEKYTVQKGDTLQKIAQKFYGTTKKWNKLYKFNQDVLKSSDKIYPGQVINIPLEPLKETKENLK